MTSRRELVLDAITAMIQAALPDAKVARNRKKPTRPDPGGAVIIRDGAPGEPDITLSPLSYTFSHRVSVEVFGFESADLSRAQILDRMLTTIGQAIEADRTLGGLTEWLEAEAPEPDEADATGTDVLAWAEFGLTCVYTTTNPLT